VPHVLRNIFSPKRGKVTADRTKRIYIYIKKCIICAGHEMPLKVKISRYRPEQALGGSGRLRLPDFRGFRHYEGGKVVTLTHRPPSPPGAFLVLIFRG
jgi:hypothetical protein